MKRIDYCISSYCSDFFGKEEHMVDGEMDVADGVVDLVGQAMDAVDEHINYVLLGVKVWCYIYWIHVVYLCDLLKSLSPIHFIKIRLYNFLGNEFIVKMHKL